MKSSFTILILTFCVICNKAIAQGQQPWVLPGNGNATSTSFVGTTNAVPLNLKTTLAQPMNFFTANTQRMTILGTTGFVGIGNTFLTPLSLLHINSFGSATGNLFRTDGSSSNTNMWQMYTGASSTAVTEKFRIYVPPTGLGNNTYLQASTGFLGINTGGSVEKAREKTKKNFLRFNT